MVQGETCNTLILFGVPTGIRTRVTGVKGRCPRPLDDGDVWLKEDGVDYSDCGIVTQAVTFNLLLIYMSRNK